MNNKPKSATSAAKSVMAGSLVIKVVSFLGSIIVARHLMPEDYGYWVLVMMIQSFFTTLLDTGIEQFYVVNVKPDFAETEEGRHYELDVVNNLLFFRIAVNIVLFLLQIILSFLPLHFLESPIGEIVRIMSLTHIFNCFGSVNKVRLQKMMDFGTITKIRFVSEFIGTSLRVIFAMSGFGVYTFALSGVSSTISNNILIAFKARFHFNKEFINRVMLKKILEFWNFSWVASTVSFTSSQLDKFFLTTFFTTTQVGYYNFGNTLTTQIQNYLLMPITSLNSTYIANNKDSNYNLQSWFSKITTVVISIVLPVFILIVFQTEIITLLVYTEKWLPATPYVRIFCIISFYLMLFYPYYCALVSIGRLRTNMRLYIYNIIFLLLVIAPVGFIFRDPILYAWTYVSGRLLMDICRVYITNKYLKIDIMKIVQEVRYLLIVNLLFICLLICISYMDIAIISKLIIGLVVMCICIFTNLSIKKNFFMSIIRHRGIV